MLKIKTKEDRIQHHSASEVGNGTPMCVYAKYRYTTLYTDQPENATRGGDHTQEILALNKNVEVRFNRYLKYLEREHSGKGPPTGKL
jgi:hypothetical protein